MTNEKEFAEDLRQLGDLYESGKGVLNKLQFDNTVLITQMEKKQACEAIREILTQMRDMAAVSLQMLYSKSN